MDNPIPENLCFLPWTGFSNDPDGKVRPCCIFNEYIKNEDGNHYYVQTATMDEIFNSTYMKNLRQDFRENKRPHQCNTCWKDEAVNRDSKRLIYNNNVFQSYDTGVNWTDEPDLPQEYQMIISNSCNLKCRSCSPSHSSQWGKEYEKFHNRTSYEMPHGQAADKKGLLWKNRKEWYPHLRRLEVVGGEPMYIKKWHVIFDELIEGGYAKDIVLDMSTNANIIMVDKIEYWAKHFKRVGMGLSIDGTGEVYDYMRSGGDWDTVYENLKEYHKLADIRNFHPQISFTLSWLNALELPKIHKLVDDEFPKFKIWNNLVYSPEWMSLRYAPEEIKNHIRDDWDKRDWGQYTGDIEGFKNFMNMPSADEKTFEYFMAKSTGLDIMRGENILDVLPEYEPYLLPYMVYDEGPYEYSNRIPIIEIGS